MKLSTHTVILSVQAKKRSAGVLIGMVLPTRLNLSIGILRDALSFGGFPI